MAQSRLMAARFDLPGSLPLLISIAVATTGTPVAAQTATGRLLDHNTGEAVDSSFVVLVDSTDREVARAPTDDDGRFTLRAPFGGRYWIVTERVGYDAPRSSAIDIGLGETETIEVAVPMNPVRLADRSESTVCSAAPTMGSAAAIAWLEARKALNAVWWTATTRDHRYTMRFFERQVGLDGHHVLSETDSVVTGSDAMPFVSGDPDRLGREGYVILGDDGSLSYFAPDPAALLALGSGDSHCATVLRDRDGGTVGVRFTPLSTSDVADIDVVFWLDASSAVLKRIEFRYVNDPSQVEDERLGGSIHVERLNGSDWMARAWRLRMPVLGPSDATDDSDNHLIGFAEVGARITEVSNGDGEVIFADQSASILTGSVYDSTRGRPLVGAVVALAGTDRWAATDERGEFFFVNAFEGRYDLVFGHPAIDSLGFVSPATPVTLRPGVSNTVQLSVPSIPRIIATRCNGAPLPERRRMLHGLVRDAGTRRPVAGAVVSVTRGVIPRSIQRMGVGDLQLTAVTDSMGTYALCGVPIGETIVVSAAADQRLTPFAQIRFGDSAVAFGSDEISLDVPIARLDLELVSVAGRNTDLAGQITDVTNGEPIVGASIFLDGTPLSSNTDSLGTFRFDGIPGGALQLVIRQLGYRMLRHDVTVIPGEALILPPNTLRMIPLDADVTTLDPIVVEASAVVSRLSGFEERRKTGFGTFMTRTDFEKWHPTVATDVVRRMRGIRVRPNPLYGTNGDSRRFLIESKRDMGQRVTQVITANAERAGTSFGAGGVSVNTECPVLIFYDGVFIGDSQTANVDDLISTTNLAAIEAYSTSQVPARFNLPGATCGVLVFWTR